MTLMEMFEQSPFLTSLGVIVVGFLVWYFVLRTKKTDNAVQNQELNKEAKPQSVTGTPPQHIAAITAAVNEYRKTENRE